MTELKPCPFCGGEELEYSWVCQAVKCKQCRARGASPMGRESNPEEWQKEVAELWNARR